VTLVAGASALARSRAYGPRLAKLAALASGSLLACAFAPLGWWPLAVVCPAALMGLWQGATPRAAAQLGFWFSAGTFGAGTYWLYTSIHTFRRGTDLDCLRPHARAHCHHGRVSGAARVVRGALPAARGRSCTLVGMPAAWLLVEWWRGWFLTGFAWLSLGYSQTDTWLAGFAPLAGVYGVSALLLMNAGAVVTLVRGGRAARIASIVILVLPWLIGFGLVRVEWTHASGHPVGVAVIQGAIPQDQKWLDANRDTTLRLYRDLDGARARHAPHRLAGVSAAGSCQ
jgi:apolipoprotein N-acyltransferase